MNEKKCIVLSMGDADYTLAERYEKQDYTFVSHNAYVASCLYNGVLVGYGQGATTVSVYKNRELKELVEKVTIIVLYSTKEKYPLFVNRWNGVPKDNIIHDLITIPKGSKHYSLVRDIKVKRGVAEAYERMAEAANKENIFFKVTFAYRSYEEQAKLIAESIKKVGVEETGKIAAPAGFSEHHTGLALDVSGMVDENNRFVTPNEDAYRWLADNCHKFGFMIKNLKGKEAITGTNYEPWHIRFIGDVETATYLHTHQLTLDEYIALTVEKRKEKMIDLSDLGEYEQVLASLSKSRRNSRDTIRSFVLGKNGYGLPFSYFAKVGLYNFSEKTYVGQEEKYHQMRKNNEKYFAFVEEDTGMTVGEILENIAIINENPYAAIDISDYAQLKLYEKGNEELEAILKAMHNARILERRILNELALIDKGERDYKQVNVLFAEYHTEKKKLLKESDIDEMRETIESCAPHLLQNREMLENTVVDMHSCKRLMGFWPFEYFMFELDRKTYAERRAYVSNIDRTQKLNKVNDRLKSEYLDNKYLAYCIMKDFYKRDIVMINSMEDYEIFEQFVSKHDRFVKKPINGAMGSGIGLVTVDAAKTAYDLLTEILNDVGSFVAEELIYSHEEIKKLNADSVNTLRMTTYNDNGNVHILWPWMKVGRAGSFVDNSGAGGMGVAIDIETGMLMSDGIDEHGNKHAIHPDNGLEFRKYRVPAWEEAITFGKEISRALCSRIDGLKFIGWDITYTEKGEWVVVEGNVFPQLVQQATYGRGFKDEIKQIIK